MRQYRDIWSCRSLALRAAAVGLAAVLGAGGASAAEFSVTVHADQRDLAAGPVALELPAALRGVATRLTDLASGKSIPIQLDSDAGTRAVFMAGPLAAGQSRRYRLSAADTDGTPTPTEGKAATRVSMEHDAGRLRVSVGDRPVLTYNIGVVESPAGMPSHYRRSGYLHPVFDPAGRVVTGDFAPDHAHQHGIFFAWVKTTFRGRPVDFWNQAKQSGRVAHDQLLQHTGGDVFGQFQVVLSHSIPVSDDQGQPVAEQPEAGHPVLRETWTVRVYAAAEDDPAAPFVFDLHSVQRCIAPEPLALEEYHYGGMAVRGTGQWLGQPEHGFLTSEGKSAIDGNHTRPQWVEMFGEIDGQPSGIAVLDHPKNFRFPQPVRLHPSKPYFCFAPVVLGEFSLPPGQDYVSSYRFVIHNGGSDPGLLRQQWQAYAEPPRVTVTEGVPGE